MRSADNTGKYIPHLTPDASLSCRCSLTCCSCLTTPSSRRPTCGTTRRRSSGTSASRPCSTRGAPSTGRRGSSSRRRSRSAGSDGYGGRGRYRVALSVTAVVGCRLYVRVCIVVGNVFGWEDVSLNANGEKCRPDAIEFRRIVSW